MKRHPLEETFNASAWDILSAIEHGFRAQVDVKGKLAEYFLYTKLIEAKERGKLTSVEWQDKDGEPDFLISVAGRILRLECKNIRSKGRFRAPDAYKVELQKTRNSKDGAPTRGYRINEFDILVVCLFNQTHEWKYLYIATYNLTRRPSLKDFLTVMQPVPFQAEGFWRNTLEDAIRDALKKEN